VVSIWLGRDSFWSEEGLVRSGAGAGAAVPLVDTGAMGGGGWSWDSVSITKDIAGLSLGAVRLEEVGRDLLMSGDLAFFWASLSFSSLSLGYGGLEGIDIR
jgi:hypothetical protein